MFEMLGHLMSLSKIDKMRLRPFKESTFFHKKIKYDFYYLLNNKKH